MRVRKTGMGPDRIAIMGRVGDKTIIRRRLAHGSRRQGTGYARALAARLGAGDRIATGGLKKLPAMLRIPDQYQRMKPDEK